jgi:hypothetical protein
MVIKRISIVFFCTFSILLICRTEAAVEKRQPFQVPLAILTPAFSSDGKFEEVFVTFEGRHEGWAVSLADDRYVKDTKRIRIDHTYRETPTQYYLISPFEAEVMNRVCLSWEATLKAFERQLKNDELGKSLYLDAYFPPFLKGFYYLFCSSKCSFSALPQVTNINDSLFDNSFNSEKSDKRITIWRSNHEHIIKLRIAAKELDYQIDKWRKTDLDNPSRDAWEDHSKEFISSLELFVRLYFNLPPK